MEPLPEECTSRMGGIISKPHVPHCELTADATSALSFKLLACGGSHFLMWLLRVDGQWHLTGDFCSAIGL